MKKVFCLFAAITLGLSLMGAAPGYAMGSLSPVSGVEAMYAVGEDGTLWTTEYGNGDWAEFVGPNVDPIDYPDALSYHIDNVVSVAAEQFASFAIDEDHVLWGWGGNLFGQLPGMEPGQGGVIKIMEGVRSVSPSSQTCLAIKEDGSLWAWGPNLLPTQIMDDICSAQAPGYGFALAEDGTLSCWLYRDIVDGTFKPKKVAGNVKTFSAGYSDLVLVKQSGEFLFMDFGDEMPGPRSEVIKVPEFDHAKYCRNQLVITQDNKLYRWFYDESLPDKEDRFQITFLMDDVVYAAQTESYVLAVTSAHELWEIPLRVDERIPTKHGEAQRVETPGKIMEPVIPYPEGRTDNGVFIMIGGGVVVTVLAFLLLKRNSRRRGKSSSPR